MNSIKSDYDKYGFLKIHSLFTFNEINRVNNEISRLLNSSIISENNLRTAFKTSHNSSYLEKIDPIVDISMPIKQIANDKRIIEICSELLNDDVYLLKDMIVLKEPNSNGFELHQDYAWWQSEENNQFNISFNHIISVVISIDEATEYNGPIVFYPEQHKYLHTAKGEIRNFNEVEKQRFSNCLTFVGLMKPGDVIFFHSLVPHYSNKNFSQESRKQLVLTYNSKSEGDLYTKQLNNYISIQHKRAKSKGVPQKVLI